MVPAGFNSRQRPFYNPAPMGTGKKEKNELNANNKLYRRKPLRT